MWRRCQTNHPVASRQAETNNEPWRPGRNKAPCHVWVLEGSCPHIGRCEFTHQAYPVYRAWVRIQEMHSAKKCRGDVPPQPARAHHVMSATASPATEQDGHESNAPRPNMVTQSSTAADPRRRPATSGINACTGTPDMSETAASIPAGPRHPDAVNNKRQFATDLAGSSIDQRLVKRQCQKDPSRAASSTTYPLASPVSRGVEQIVKSSNGWSYLPAKKRDF